MSTAPATPQAARAARFFALTAERLDAVVQHGLTRAELLVWAHVELRAKPRCPVPFTLEAVATCLDLSTDTASRAVRRLLHVGLLVGMYAGKRYRLAPAAGAFENGAPVPDFAAPHQQEPPAGDVGQDQENGARVPGEAPENGARVPGADPEEARHNEAGDLPPKLQAPERSKKSFMACALTKELISEWGLFGPVAARLVATHGRDRVGQVLEWGRHLRAAGKLKSRGWAYQALVRGWDAPDSFHATRHKAQEGPSEPTRVPQDPPSVTTQAEEPLDEAARIATLRDMYSKPLPALRRMAVRLAGEWGVSLEALGAHAV